MKTLWTIIRVIVICVVVCIIAGGCVGCAVALYQEANYTPDTDPTYTEAHYQGGGVYYIPLYMGYRHDLYGQAFGKLKREHPNTEFSTPVLVTGWDGGTIGYNVYVAR